jgi:hypothetical protein
MLASSIAKAVRSLTRRRGAWYAASPLQFTLQSLQFSSEKKLHSVHDHYVEKTPITAQLWEMRKQDGSAEQASGANSVVNAKTVEQSRLNVRYNFTQNPNLRDLYVDHTGNVLMGKLFEDMDALAGNVALRHCSDGGPKRLSLVTASVDEIIQKNPIPVDEDILLIGKPLHVQLLLCA